MNALELARRYHRRGLTFAQLSVLFAVVGWLLAPLAGILHALPFLLGAGLALYLAKHCQRREDAYLDAAPLAPLPPEAAPLPPTLEGTR